MKRRRRSSARTNRARAFAAFLILACVAIAGFLFFSWFTRLPRLWSVAILTNPVVVVSWDRPNGRFIMTSLPADAIIEAVSGYGRYSLEALWRLDRIDRKAGALITQSLADALAVPVSWYIAAPGDALVDSADEPEAIAQRWISLGSLPYVIIGRYDTNLPPVVHLMMSVALSFVRPDKTDVISLAGESACRMELLPDGTRVCVVDVGRVDYILDDVFEDDGVRGESISVSLLNTTTTSALGSRASRALTRLGIHVISVANDNPQIHGCTIHGTKQALRSYTARVIQQILDCSFVEKDEERSSDLVVRIGTAYRDQFLPPKQ